MNIIFLLIFVSLIIAICFLGAFFWAVQSGQYEDDVTPAMRILLEDKKENKSTENSTSRNEKSTITCRH